MHIPWMLACVPAFFVSLPQRADLAAIRDHPLLRQNPPVTTRQVVRDTRGFGVVIDHQRREIKIKAWFFAARQDPAAKRQLRAILTFWQRQNGRFVYRLKTPHGKVDYRIGFDLREAPGSYGPQGFFLPDSQVSLALLNQVEVVPKDQLDRLHPPRPQQRVVGYAPNNFIYIASDVADQTWIGIHEAGHRLGVGHHSLGIMREEVSPAQRYLPRQAVREMLASADIIGRGWRARSLARYPVRAAEVMQQGETPVGFFTQGKVKRH
mgnify:CR=1 FL=1